MKYEGYYYCGYCQVWVKADSPEVYYNRMGWPYHAFCQRRMRTKPRKPCRKTEKPRINPEPLLVTPVTGGRP